MEVSSEISPSLNPIALTKEKVDDPDLQDFELASGDDSFRSTHRFHSTNALEILRETVRILRHNATSLVGIAAFLICPVSALVLSNLLVNQSLVDYLSIRLMLVANYIGLPLRPFIKHSCQKFSETTVSAIMCFPLFITISLLSKSAVVHTVECTYSRKVFDLSKFIVLINKIWKRVVVTYLWGYAVIIICIILFFTLLIAVGSVFSVMGFPPDLILYPAVVVALIFSIILANSIIICNVALVISVLEDVSGSTALVRSSSLVKGQKQVGLLIFLGSTIGLALVEGLFEHRVKTLSYGDGSSRLWEGPLLVMMYSFELLLDSMVTTVFYFSCKFYRMEASSIESQPVFVAGSIP